MRWGSWYLSPFPCCWWRRSAKGAWDAAWTSLPSGLSSAPHSWRKSIWLAITCSFQLLGWPWILLPKELFFTWDSLSTPMMGCIELVLLTAKGIPCCQIRFPVSVNHLTAAFPDSYASDLWISPFFLIYDTANHSIAVHHSTIRQSHWMLQNITIFYKHTHIYTYTKFETA